MTKHRWSRGKSSLQNSSVYVPSTVLSLFCLLMVFKSGLCSVYGSVTSPVYVPSMVRSLLSILSVFGSVFSVYGSVSVQSFFRLRFCFFRLQRCLCSLQGPLSVLSFFGIRFCLCSVYGSVYSSVYVLSTVLSLFCLSLSLVLFFFV